MMVLGYLGAVLMGLSLGLMGAGGSILTVPVFVYLFLISPQVATGLSLFVVGSVSAAATLGYVRNKQVEFKSGLLFALTAGIDVFSTRRFLKKISWRKIFLPFSACCRRSFRMLCR